MRMSLVFVTFSSKKSTKMSTMVKPQFVVCGTVRPLLLILQLVLRQYECVVTLTYSILMSQSPSLS